jgi:ADP-ribose pyrophosphatase
VAERAGSSRSFRRLSREVRYEGSIIAAGLERFVYADGVEVVRDKVWHPGAVAILPVDEGVVWLVRQPREAIGEPSSLEIPAGKRDVPGEPPLETARRELAEEIGLAAGDWQQLFEFYPTPGFADEHLILYRAGALTPAAEVEHPDQDERIEIVRWPLAELDAAIAQCRDAKSLVALLWLARRQDAAAGPAAGPD